MEKNPVPNSGRADFTAFSQIYSLSAVDHFRSFFMLLACLWLGIPTTLSAQTENSHFQPCDAFPYVFNNGTNVVPCGPAANATPSVGIVEFGHTGGPGVNGSCGALGDGGSPEDVLWVTFIIQEGGSYEWQTVPGSDDFYWELYYTPDIPNENDPTGGCGNLVFYECGQEFTGWKVQPTPDPTRRWRFFMAFYLRNGDQEGDGVIKIRKSCGLGCTESDIAVSVAADKECTDSGAPVQLTASASGGMGSGSYKYIWTAEPEANAGLPDANTPVMNAVVTATPNPAVPPAVIYTYSVTAYDESGDRCPATAEVEVQVGECFDCNVVAGTITNTGNGPLSICQRKELVDVNGDAVDFSVNNQTAPNYALLLVDMNGKILDEIIGTSGSFNFSTFTPKLTPGMYFVYGLAFDPAKPGSPASVDAYLATQTNISGIQKDIADELICAALVDGGASNKITITKVDCGTSPETSGNP